MAQKGKMVMAAEMREDGCAYQKGLNVTASKMCAAGWPDRRPLNFAATNVRWRFFRLPSVRI